jgi:hypothetical protein
MVGMGNEKQQRRTGGMANRRETSGCRRKREDAGEHIKPLDHALS